MLSNSKLGVFTRLAPIELVVVDEASQIGIGDYLPMIFRSQTLQKIVFIRDDKQCS
jgi:regulator of nonsense transcripts 1